MEMESRLPPPVLVVDAEEPDAAQRVAQDVLAEPLVPVVRLSRLLLRQRTRVRTNNPMTLLLPLPQADSLAAEAADKRP